MLLENWVYLYSFRERKEGKGTYRSQGGEGGENGGVTHFDGCDGV
jgi:hypothetical protein